MNIALIGPTGFVGSKVLEELLLREHTVKTMLRIPEKLLVKDERLTVFEGDALKETDLLNLFDNVDAVISCYNAGWSNKNYYDDFKKGYYSILTAIRKTKTKRILIVGGAASLKTESGVYFFDTDFIPNAYKPLIKAPFELYLEMLKEENLDWTFLSPALDLKSGNRIGKYRLGTDNPVLNENGDSTISTSDLAVAIVDEIENSKFIKQRFTVGY